MTLAEQIGQLIRAEKKRQGMSTRAMAHAAGVSPTTAARVEAGLGGVRVASADACMRALGLRVTLALSPELSRARTVVPRWPSRGAR